MKREMIKFVLGILIFTIVGFVNQIGFASALIDTDSDGYLEVHNCTELQNMSLNLSANYELMNNIDCSAFVNFVPVGEYPDSFVGNFDGNNYTISDLTIILPTTNYVGLFGNIDNSANLSDIGLINVNISGKDYVGGLVGGVNTGLITNSYSTGNIKGTSNVGGIVGYSLSSITNSYSTSNITSSSFYVGGLAGSSTGSITNSYSTGNVNGYSAVGGLVGENDGSITNSYSTSNVNGGQETGGLVGRGDGVNIITNSYSTGNVNGSSSVGGFIGVGYAASITNSYSTGNTTGFSKVGGFLGFARAIDVSITGSYWDVNTSGQLTSNGTEEGKTTLEMKNVSTFVNWDWDIWDIKSSKNEGYPFLAFYDTDVIECRNLTGKGLTYILLNNISNGIGDCLIIQADNITINGNGFNITGNINASGVGDGANASTNLVLNNITINGSIYSNGADSSDSDAGDGGRINLTYSNITGNIFSIGGDTGGVLNYAGDSGILTIMYSEVSNISSSGGNGIFGGFSGSIVILNSTIRGISSLGGNGVDGIGGNSGVISINYSNITNFVTSIGGDSGVNAGFSGLINIIGSNISGSILSKGGHCLGGSFGGDSNNINIIDSEIKNITTQGGDSDSDAGGNSGNISIRGDSINISSNSISIIPGLGGFSSNGILGYLILNYSSFEDTNAVYSNMNLKITRNGYGLLDFGEIEGAGLSNISINLIIENNSVYLNSTAIPRLNKSAEITLYGLRQRENPGIYRSYTLCNSSTDPACVNLTQMNSGTVKFNVSSWTESGANYSIKDPAVLIQNIIYNPSALDDIDPNTTMTFNVSLLYDFPINATFLEIHNGTGWENNKTMNLLGSVYTVNFTTFENDTNYTYKVYVNNSVGEVNESANVTFKSEYDCSFTISDSYGNVSDGDLGEVGGYSNWKALGNITFNNTGDLEYSNGCIIKFTSKDGSNWPTTAIEANNNLSLNYLLYIIQNYGGLTRGLNFSINGTENTSITLGFSESAILEISGFFTNDSAASTEHPYFQVLANVTDTVDLVNNITVSADMIITPGAYLIAAISSPIVESYTIPLTVGEYNFSAYVRNIVEGEDNNVAANVTLNWSLPSEINERSINKNLFFGPTALNNTSFLGLINFTLKLENNSYLENLTFRDKNYEINISASGYNYSGILLAQGEIYDSASILFECYSINDGLCVTDCRFNQNPLTSVYYNTSDPDCGRCGDGVSSNSPLETCSTCPEDVGVCPVGTSSGGGGGGGGGGAGGSFAKSEANFELVRGENQEFELVLENKLSNPKNNVTIRITGNNSQYVSAEPSILSYIGANSNESIRFKINAPSYFSSGKYLLQIEFSGTIEGNTSTKFTEVKYVTLTILELPRKEADGYINKSLEILSKMNSSGLYLDEVQDILDSMNSNYENLNFISLKDEASQIENIYTSATEYLKLKDELNQSMIESEKNGIEVSETKKLFYLSEILFNRGDYVAAYAKLKEAKTSYLLETKGEFKIIYFVKNNPVETLGILVSLSLVGVGSGLLIRLRLVKRKLKMLAEEEALLLELMKVVQRDCFENNTMSMEEYNEAMYQYEGRLSNIIQEKVKTESEVANLMKLQGKKNALAQEKARLFILIKQTQEDYLNRAKLDTRVYENMLKTYSSRLNKVEEEVVYIEAKEQIRAVSGFWHNWFGKKRTKR